MSKSEQESKERSFLVVKDTQLITKSRYSLTLQQQKILLYFISRIKPDDEDNTMYELSIKDFAKICGYVEDSGFYYQTIKADIKELHDKSSWIEMENGKEVLFSWIDRAEIDKGKGTIRVSFHYTVAPYLFELRERYTKYSLSNILCLTHKYSIRLYEYLCAVRYKGDFKISVDELKKRLDAETYVKYSHFKDRVLNPSVYDIVQYTDMNISYETEKTGKAVTHIIFKFNEKSDYDNLMTDIAKENHINPDKRKKGKELDNKLKEKRKNTNKESKKVGG